MAETTLLSIRIPVEVAERLAALAEVMKRSKSFLGAAAIEEYVASQEWQIHEIKQGITSADAGDLVEHENIVQWVERWGTAHEKDRP
jgi:RHH-type transcriptional regulator, rel operon repressor / antitoxin RelB